MSKNKKQSFLQGALVLVVASLMVKFIGFFFKIPLTYLIHDDGMGLFNSAYQIYTVLFIVATAGFPTAISKMVAESLALDRKLEAERIFRVAIYMLGAVGIGGSLFLYFGADFIAGIIKNTRSVQAIQAIAPAVLCVSFMAVFRGYFQGRQNMFPTAISEVCEATGKLVFGYLFAWLFISHSVEKASAGAVFGVTMGSVLGLFALLIMYTIHWKKRDKNLRGEESRSYKQIAAKLFLFAFPITLGASVSSLTNLVDMVMVMRRLQTITQVTPEFLTKFRPMIEQVENFNGAAINEQLANSLYGMYTGKALALFNFPLTLVVALGMSVVPVISAALARKDKAGAQNAVNSVIKITMIFAVPCAIGMYVLAEPILNAVFDNALATSVLQKLAVSIIFVALLQITTSVLQSYGRTVVPVVNMFVGGVIKIIINYILVAIPSVNIDGAPIGTMVCYIVIVALNMIWVVKETKCKFGIIEYVVKPLLSGGVMGVVTYFVYNGISFMGNTVAMGIAIMVAIVVYLAMLIVVRAFREDDIMLLPKGEKILKLFRKFHLI